MSKPKGPTWEQVGEHTRGVEAARPVEGRPYDVVDYHRRMGRSTVTAVCPFCRRHIEAYSWSLAGGGKRCECGALLGSTGTAFHWPPAVTALAE